MSAGNVSEFDNVVGWGVKLYLSCFRKHSSGDLHSRLKTRKVLGVGATDNGDVHRSKVGAPPAPKSLAGLDVRHTHAHTISTRTTRVLLIVLFMRSYERSIHNAQYKL